MHRLAVAVVFLSTVRAVAQNPASDPQAISLAQQSVAALANRNAISDVTLNANVVSTIGPDSDTGSGTLYANGTTESRIDLILGNGTSSDVRNVLNGSPGGGWNQNGGAFTGYAQHNCWTDAAWFFPALSSLTQTANQNFVYKYIGQEQHAGVNTQHIQAYQVNTMQRLSTMDFYLDATSTLPVTMAFATHPDNDINTDLAVEIQFGNYQAVNGTLVPFHLSKLLNDSVVLDITVTSAVFNSGLPESLFTVQ